MSRNNLVVERDKLQFTMSRVFDAPLANVWKACTDPELIPKWWGPCYLTTVVDKMDVRVGGAWRFIQTDADGNVYAFNGVFTEIQPLERLAYTFEFEPMAGHISTDTISFEELPDDRTRLTSRSTFDTLEDLEGILQSGMEGGAVETWDRLNELAGSLLPTPDPALQRLERFVGTWSVHGRTLDSQQDNVSGRITFEWLPGGYFLQQRIELDFAGYAIQGLELIGYDPSTQTFPSTVFSSMVGIPLPYKWEVQGNDVKIRTDFGGGATYTGRFSQDGNSMAGGWRPDEGKEGPGNVAYDISGTRVK